MEMVWVILNAGKLTMMPDDPIFHYSAVKDTMPSEKGGFAYMDFCTSAIKEIRAVNIPYYVKAFNNLWNDTGELSARYQ